MKRVTITVLVIFALTILFLHDTSNALLSKSTSISSEGSIFIPERFYVKPFGFRIADMMVDLLPPNFDDGGLSTAWQAALDDLASASSNGEITHVQLRTFWRVDPNNRSTWENPELGALDEERMQQAMCENWKKWVFGSPEPTYGPCAAKRIHDAGFKLEFCLSTAWNPGVGTLADSIPVWGWGGREADYNFDGELFLQNYMDNCLRPIAQFLASSQNFQNGDIFMLSFEMNYPTADFTWSHNEKWRSIINVTRGIFREAGKSIVLTIDHSGWYDDFGLGYDAVKLLNSSAPILAVEKGISGASYLGELDFISLSVWLPLLPYNSSLIPATWNDSDIPWVTDLWFNNPCFFKVGTGYNGISGVYGRDFIADYRALSSIMQGKKILMNTGWRNGHGELTRSLIGGADNQEQRVAWAAQLRAINDPQSNMTVWCAGQDFERYCRDKAMQPDYIDTSWRKAPAEAIIIEIIREISSAP